MQAPEPVDRRGALRALAALFSALFALPGLAAVLDPILRARRGGWVSAGMAGALAPGAVQRFSYEVKAGWETRKQVCFLVRKGDEIIALSARCTHLGCRVRLKNSIFACPCHGGEFDLKGQPQRGPVKQPLERLRTRVKKGRIEVRT